LNILELRACEARLWCMELLILPNCLRARAHTHTHSHTRTNNCDPVLRNRETPGSIPSPEIGYHE